MKKIDKFTLFSISRVIQTEKDQSQSGRVVVGGGSDEDQLGEDQSGRNFEILLLTAQKYFLFTKDTNFKMKKK